MVATAFVIAVLPSFIVSCPLDDLHVAAAVIVTVDVSFAHIASNEFVDGLSVSVFSLFSLSATRQFRSSMSFITDVLCDGMFVELIDDCER